MAVNQFVLASNWSLTSSLINGGLGGGVGGLASAAAVARVSDVQLCLASAKDGHQVRFVRELNGEWLRNGVGVGWDDCGWRPPSVVRRRGLSDEVAGMRIISCVSTSEVSTASDSSAKLPLKTIPGEYGGMLGAIKDRLDFFWFQGLGEFFSSRVKKYGSTVFRVNMPPGPPGFPDPRVILLLDAKSYPVLFDVDKVEKKDVFTGTYHPSWDFTGGVRVLAYLDPSEERHTRLKSFVFEILKSNGRKFLPEFHKAISESFAVWESSSPRGRQRASPMKPNNLPSTFRCAR